MKAVYVVAVLLMMNFGAKAQLTDGSISPDFTFTDINGNTQNLYTLLGAGKTVVLDISTTWCSPCWAYHNTRVMDSLYTLHDVAGDNTWRVLFIEGDAGTTNADLHGTGTVTEGDWVTGSLFPIIDPAGGVQLNDFLANYNVSYWPTFFMICPNKKVYQDTLNASSKPPVGRWEYLAVTSCGALGLDNMEDRNPVTIYPNPAKNDIAIYFSLNAAANIKVTLTDITGAISTQKKYDHLQAGDQVLHLDVSSYAAGMYLITLTNGENRIVHRKVSIQ